MKIGKDYKVNITGEIQEKFFTPTPLSELTNSNPTNNGLVDKNDDLLVDEVIEIGDLKGNRNLIINGNFSRPPSTWDDGLWEKTTDGILAKKNTGDRYGIITDQKMNLLANTDYTLSFESRSDDSNALDYNYVIDTSGNVSISQLYDLPLEKEWRKHLIQIKLTADKPNSAIMIATSAGTSFELRNIKLEKGSIATEYSLSPEDMGIQMDFDKFGFYQTKDGKLFCNEIIES